MVVVSHLFLFYGKISGADVTWYESHLPLFGTIYFPIAPFSIHFQYFLIHDCIRSMHYCIKYRFLGIDFLSSVFEKHIF